MEENSIPYVCRWIGNGEGCRHPTIYKKSYCEYHYSKVYISMPFKVADYIIENELKELEE